MDLRGWTTFDLIYVHFCVQPDHRHYEMGGCLRCQGKPVRMGKARGNKGYPQLFSGFFPHALEMARTTNYVMHKHK
jgi:hypothetical protein